MQFFGVRGEFFQKLRAFFDDDGGVFAKLFVPYGERIQNKLRVTVFEQSIPLVENLVVSEQSGIIGGRGLRNGHIHEPPPLVGAVLNESEFSGRKKYAVDVSHEVCAFGNFAPVDADFPFVLVDVRFDRDLAVTVFRLGGNACAGRADFNELFVVADS